MLSAFSSDVLLNNCNKTDLSCVYKLFQIIAYFRQPHCRQQAWATHFYEDWPSFSCEIEYLFSNKEKCHMIMKISMERVCSGIGQCRAQYHLY